MSPRKLAVDPWPWPADNPLERARRVALIYRNAVMEFAPDACGDLDANVEAWGEKWINPSVVRFDPDDLLTAKEAADTANVKVGTIYEWRRRGLRVTPTPDGPRYRMGDLLDYNTNRRRRRVKQ